LFGPLKSTESAALYAERGPFNLQLDGITVRLLQTTTMLLIGRCHITLSP